MYISTSAARRVSVLAYLLGVHQTALRQMCVIVIDVTMAAGERVVILTRL